MVTWRHVTDRLKHSPAAMSLADWMGRGRGRMRFLDRVYSVKQPRKPDLMNWHQQDLAAAWIGHATVLLRVGGMTILTDPVFSNRVGVGLGLFTGGPHRQMAPALEPGDLPPIDLVLLSHAHFDHLDRPTLAKLPKRVPIISAYETADLIRDLGFRRVTEMRWGESLQMASLKVTAQKVKHWGARTFVDQHRGFCAFVLEAGRRRVLYGGDTAYCDYFREVGKVDLAILGIGGYDPYLAAHATPEQAWEMADHVRADFVLPMHHSTFRLSHEPIGEPMERMLQVAGRGQDRLIIREVGGQWGV